MASAADSSLVAYDVGHVQNLHLIEHEASQGVLLLEIAALGLEGLEERRHLIGVLFFVLVFPCQISWNA